MRGAIAVQLVEVPDLFTGSGIDCYDTQLGGGHEHRAIDNDRVALDVGVFVSVVAVERPGDFQSPDVLGVDLTQGGVMNRIRSAAHDTPAAIIGRRNATCTSSVNAEA